MSYKDGPHLISIIVPIYNVDMYLDKCIKSILSQTFRNLQIILVDDGSVDTSLDICRKYGKQDSRIVIIHKENTGLVSARKTGIQAAEGDFIGYVDGDDWIEPDMYEHLYQTMLEYDVDMVETAHFCDAGNMSRKMQSKIKQGYYLQQDLLPNMLCDENFNECRLTPYVWSKLFKRRILLDAQMQVDERIRLGEDAAVTYPYMLKSRAVYISDYAGYHYIQRKGSMCVERNKDDRQSNMILIRYLKSIFIQDQNVENLSMQLNQYAKLLLLLRQIECFDQNRNGEVLLPYGGLQSGNKIVIYGAGSLGKSIYGYLNNVKEIEIIAWVDQLYEMYQILGWHVSDPRKIMFLKGKYDRIVIAAYCKRTADSIKEYLINNGVKKEQIMWITSEFISKDIIHAFPE